MEAANAPGGWVVWSLHMHDRSRQQASISAIPKDDSIPSQATTGGTCHQMSKIAQITHLHRTLSSP